MAAIISRHCSIIGPIYSRRKGPAIAFRRSDRRAPRPASDQMKVRGGYGSGGPVRPTMRCALWSVTGSATPGLNVSTWPRFAAHETVQTLSQFGPLSSLSLSVPHLHTAHAVACRRERRGTIRNGAIPHSRTASPRPCRRSGRRASVLPRWSGTEIPSRPVPSPSCRS